MNTRGLTQRRVVALLLLIVALGGLGVVALGAAAEHPPAATYVGPTERILAPEKIRQGYDEPIWETHDVVTQPPQIFTSRTPVIVALSVLGVVLLVLLVWLMVRMRALARPAPAIAAEAGQDELTAAQARAALEEARTPLSTVVDVQDAVIAAWLVLERSLAESGVPRRPSATTLEFVVEVLANFALDRDSLDRLSALYRRALFDPEPLLEADRTAAMAALDRLTEDLEQLAAPAGRRSSGSRAGASGADA